MIMRCLNPHIPFIELVALVDRAQVRDPEARTQSAEFALGSILNAAGPVVFFEALRRLCEERAEELADLAEGVDGLTPEGEARGRWWRAIAGDIEMIHKSSQRRDLAW